MAPRRGAGGGGGRRSRPPLNEDNARFCLLAALILLYLLAGAGVFSALERPFELRARRRWARRLEEFRRTHGVGEAALHGLLRDYEDANGAGIRVDALRPRWDFSGAFYFVGTVVSTIGFGMNTPATVSGKIFLIFYGLLGCAATILFFNLFLERIITMLAYIMRWFHQRQLRCSGAAGSGGRAPRHEDDSLEGWKPSVYIVMLILGVASVVIACSASALYSAMEGWSYLDALYFCFVAFSTIGFGDLVSSQRDRYEGQAAYRLGNGLFILMGVCCIYSLFNVISIVIKQTLNWILAKLASSRARRPPRCPWRSRRHAAPPAGRARRFKGNSVQPLQSQPGPRRYAGGSLDSGDSETDGGAGGGGGACPGRRLSGEMISVNEFNKVSLALLQKQLSDTARHQGHAPQSHAHLNGFSGGVGALAIMNNRLQETSGDRPGDPIVAQHPGFLTSVTPLKGNLLIQNHFNPFPQGFVLWGTAPDGLSRPQQTLQGSEEPGHASTQSGVVQRYSQVIGSYGQSGEAWLKRLFSRLLIGGLQTSSRCREAL